MNLFINGELVNFNQNSLKVKDIIDYYSLLEASILVELNNSIIDRENYLNTYLKDKDKIELIKIVGGG